MYLCDLLSQPLAWADPVPKPVPWERLAAQVSQAAMGCTAGPRMALSGRTTVPWSVVVPWSVAVRWSVAASLPQRLHKVRLRLNPDLSQWMEASRP